MKVNKKKISPNINSTKQNFVERLWDEGWAHIKTVLDVDIKREPILILDKDLRVISANESFYKMFQVEPKDTENKLLYKLGNNQWNIPTLKKLLLDIITKNTFFKGFEVTWKFPTIGRKIMILNARQIRLKDDINAPASIPIIFLAMEDVTEIMIVAETIASHANKLKADFIKKEEKLKKEINKLKKKK